jgi:FkbH-like protein
VSSPIALRWLPELPDPTAAFHAVKDTADPRARLERIFAMAQHQLDFVQVGKLDRQLERTLAELPEPPDFQPVRLAWLGSSTLEHLLPAARIACLRRRLLLHSYLAPYGQYRQELLDPGSALARWRPDVAVLCLDHEHGLVDPGIGATRDEAVAAVDRRVDELRQIWRLASEQLGCAVIHETTPILAPALFGSFDRAAAGSPVAVQARLDHAIAEAAAAERVALLDLATWSSRLGSDTWFDPVRWHQAKQLVAPPLAPLWGDLLARVIAALRGRSQKCLVLDLDNTLWGGVVGDDGVERLVIGQGSAAGEAFAAFQRYARQLKERGIVLAVCSKNERAIAESAFTSHPDMVLRLDDFAVFVANWKDKATNLRQIAEALNIGLDALVFFDDNPAERALVRAELPMVAVPEVPEDPAHFSRVLADAGYFEAASFTADDLARARQYQDSGRRQQAFESATDMNAFLSSLAMRLQIGEVDAQSLARVTQLINKTNQFNVTTRRYTEPALRGFASDPSSIALHFRLADRFGDNGLIAVVLARTDTAARLAIDSFVMSCRVLGRGVELAIMNEIVERARARGVREITGEYIPTARNALVADLFARLGFTQRGPGAAGGTSWTLAVDAYAPHAHFIRTGEST